MHQILVVCGKIGSGKDTFVEVASELLGECNIKHFPTSQPVALELERRGLPLSRENLTIVALELLKKNGYDFIGKAAEEFIRQLGDERSYVIIVSGFRPMPSLVYFLKKFPQAKTVYLDCGDDKVRYRRKILQADKVDAAQMTYLEFCRIDRGPIECDLDRIRQLSDYRLLNNRSLRIFKNEVRKFFVLQLLEFLYRV